MSSITFEFSFSDITLLEADGVFEEVEKMMLEDRPVTPESTHPQAIEGWSPKVDTWMIRSNITIESQFGIANLTVHAHSDKRMVIKAYQPSVGDVYYNPDMQAFSEWCQSNGWKPPEPAVDLVKDNIDFWRHYWQTLLVDSPYLDSVYGVRPHMQDEE